MKTITHEVCIVGAGPVGLALANCLVRSPHISSIALIDKKMPKVLPEAYSIPNQRVYAVNAPSLKLLENLGALSKVRQLGRLNHIEVMSKEAKSFIEWEEQLAKVIENDQIVSALTELLRIPEFKNKIEWIEGQIDSFSNEQYSGCEIQLKDRRVRAKLLVGSDGNRSKVKQLAKIATYGWSYRQKAIACTLGMDALSEEENRWAYQIYHDNNILGILPLWKNYISIVWSLNIPDFEHTMQLSNQQFLDSLNALIDENNQIHRGKLSFKPMGHVGQLINKRLAFPLSTLQAESYTKHRLALIGDAAHSIHPMAGLGVNSGFQDAAMLANNIIINKKTGNDIGEAISLSGYQSKSKAMNYGNSLAMESIKKGFEANLGPLESIRSSVIGWLQGNKTLKQRMREVVANNPLIDVPRYEWEHP